VALPGDLLRLPRQTPTAQDPTPLAPFAGFPPRLAEDEIRMVLARRVVAASTCPVKTDEDRAWAATVADPDLPAVGLALSGGGIRSATVSLGLLQGLVALGLLPRVDYLSTVSGGGYIGGFLGSVFIPQTDRDPPDPTSPAPAWQGSPAQALAPNADPLRWLRDNGRYLAPNGGGDVMVALAVLLRNLVSIHVVLGLLVLAILLTGHLLRAALALCSQLLPIGLGLPLRTLFLGDREAIWVISPFSMLALGGLLFAMVPLGWAYWLVPNRLEWTRRGCDALPPLGVAALALVAGTLTSTGGPLTAVALIGAGAYVLAEIATGIGARGGGNPVTYGHNVLSQWLRLAVSLVLLCAAIALVDSLGQSLYGWLHTRSRIENTSLGGAAVGALIAATMYLAPLVKRAVVVMDSLKPRMRAVLGPAALALALMLVLSVGMSTLSYAIAWRGEDLRRLAPSQVLPALTWIAGATLLAGILCVVFGRVLRFLNLSSQAQFYGSRLTRAYLGATNQRRQTSSDKRLSRPLPGDEMRLRCYRPHRFGGPLHLINVTLNETIVGETQVEQRDRQGMNLCFGPAGVSAAVKHHARWADTTDELEEMAAGTPASACDTEDVKGDQLVPLAPTDGFRIFHPRPDGKPIAAYGLRLGQLLAISGAAFTTGIGARTNLAMSLLSGLLNVRLGHWWDTTIDPAWRRQAVDDQTGKQATRLSISGKINHAFRGLLPVQAHLLDEFLARFPGPSSPRWYLSDGGHFDNTALYELLRRRVPFMVMCDNGADPDYQFEDVADLVRKARVDFGAGVRFLADDELDRLLHPAARRHFTELPGLHRPAGDRYAKAYAALAEITWFDDPRPTVLILIKPTLLGDESVDLLTYQRLNPDFPQQPTIDQFFDEAQWESYRALGEYAIRAVFARHPPVAPHQPSWQPADCLPWTSIPP